MNGRYRPIAQGLHWLIAATVIFLLGAGLVMHYDLVGKPTRADLSVLHFGFGLAVLVLMALRLLYRLRRAPPPPLETLAPHERLLAEFGHWSFYALILAMPIFGVLFVEAGGHPVTFFHLFTLPVFVGRDAAIHHVFAFLHFWCGIALIALLAVHVGAVALHESRGEPILRRMLPWTK